MKVIAAAEIQLLSSDCDTQYDHATGQWRDDACFIQFAVITYRCAIAGP